MMKNQPGGNSENTSQVTAERVVYFLNEKIPPQLWYSNGIRRETIIDGFKAYLNNDNGNAVPREQKVETARFALVHGLPSEVSITLEDIGVTQEEISKFKSESDRRMAKEMLEALRLETKKSPEEFIGKNPRVLEWASGANKVEAIRDLISKHQLTAMDIDSTEEELERLSTWKPPQIGLN